jgi:FAD/FMN-containing dehydrogenase
VIDNLLEVEMVVSDGEVVTASRDTNKALVWAVRGAGASFGVVTSFKFQAHEQKKPVWGGTLVIKEHQLDRVVAFANEFLEVSFLLDLLLPSKDIRLELGITQKCQGYLFGCPSCRTI